MFERFLCDFIYTEAKRVEITELICDDRAEALDWLSETFLELHRDHPEGPDVLCLRGEDDVIAEWGTHFDALERTD